MRAEMPQQSREKLGHRPTFPKCQGRWQSLEAMAKCPQGGWTLSAQYPGSETTGQLAVNTSRPAGQPRQTGWVRGHYPLLPAIWGPREGEVLRIF